MRFKDAFIGVGSFILGSLVTLNVISLTLNEKTNRNNAVDDSSGLKSSKDIKLFSAINYFLIVVVISTADNIPQRTAIRETWGLLSNDFPDVRYFFIVGNNGLSNEKISKIKKEQIRHNDMFLMSVSDGYESLTEKVMHAFAWFSTEFNFKYILKCDDDSFVVVPRVIKELKNTLHIHKHLYWGYFDGRAHIKKTGKWNESKWFLCDRYLPYALGGGYVLSHSLVQYINENKHMLGLYLSEDVSVGVWLSPLNITRLHDARFDTEYLSRGCSNDFVVTHKQSPKRMRTLYSTLTDKGVLCESETFTRKAYAYNWTVLPTKCCTV